MQKLTDNQDRQEYENEQLKMTLVNVRNRVNFYVNNNNSMTYRYAGSELQHLVSEWLNHDHF